ncbi:MAG: RluA family pseudouridine synthase [Verrucomicrobium sp.]|nr:RluA family pseudouridine synthase [Verrucomicrobium sp.]
MHFSAEDLIPHRDRRLDQFLAEVLNRSRAAVQTAIEAGGVTVTPGKGPGTKASYRLRAGDAVDVREETLERPVSEAPPEGEAMPLSILFEDEALLVLDKPPGLVVHPAAGHDSGTLVNALVHHCGPALASRGGATRLGIVHRLDKETSGVIVVAKSDLAHERLASQFAARTVRKVYQALCRGHFRRPNGHCHGSIGRHPVQRQKMAVIPKGKPSTTAREAHTEYRVLKQGKSGALVECLLHTGRTHQIRVHLAHLGHPVIGDIVYGRDRTAWKNQIARRQMLHAHRLGLRHPLTGKEIEFEAPLPEDFSSLLAFL